MTRSEPLRESPPHPMPQVPPEGRVEYFMYEWGRFRGLDYQEVAHKAPKDLIGAPYVFRFDIPGKGRAYFTDDEALFAKLQGEGKTVRWLHDLFGAYNKELIQMGLPSHTSIYLWTIDDMRVHWAALKEPNIQMAVEVLGAEVVEVRR